MTAVVFAALVLKVVDTLKLTLDPASRRQAVTQLVAWAIGIGAVALGAHAAITEDVVIPGTKLALHSLDAASCVFGGFLVGSLASVGNDFKQAFDNTDSAAKPPLV